MTTIIPVLLCGGVGTRLWPLSRKSYPKQFVPLTGEETLFQASARRLNGKGCGPEGQIDFAHPVVLSNSDFRFIVTEQLGHAGIDIGAVLIEPDGRNTAPAILAAALHVEASSPGAIMLIAPSDHVLPDAKALHAAIALGLGPVSEGRLVTFGIHPTRPDTAYGYLECEAEVEDDAARPLVRFVEKPDRLRAENMLASGRFLWNAGIIMARATDLIVAVREHASDLCAPVEKAVAQARRDLGFLRLDAEAWSQAENVSIDYAVMEKADNLSVVPFKGEWSDLGGWDAVWRESGPDAAGVVTSAHATAIDCRDTLLRSESERLEIVGIGLDNVMAIAMKDAVLVADMSRAQEVGKAVEILQSKEAAQATMLPKDHRPWGWFESLVLGPRFQVKRILVHPGASLSLQSHHHRSEHWIVVEGTAKVTVDDEVTLLTENQSIYVPLGAVHRMENPGKLPMVLIEVQTGAYVGEDDIVRYEDVYARN